MKKNIIESLKSYIERYASEKNKVKQMIKFYEDYNENRPSCFDRQLSCGHFTASALVYNKKREVLLLKHKKLNKWLQPGGHADGDKALLEVAKKELKEETFLDGIETVNNEPFDIDIHSIPANKKEQAHLHYDVRFLFEADKDLLIKKNDESNEVKWIPIKKIQEYTDEESILRMVSKLENYLSLTLVKKVQ